MNKKRLNWAICAGMQLVWAIGIGVAPVWSQAYQQPCAPGVPMQAAPNAYGYGNPALQQVPGVQQPAGEAGIQYRMPTRPVNGAAFSWPARHLLI